MALLTLEEAKTALRLKDNDAARDALLESFIEGVTSVVEAEVGWVDQRTLVLDIRQGGCEVALPGRNILSLTSGEYAQSGDPVDLDGVIVSDAGVLYRLNGGALPLEPWSLTLEVGMDPIPEAIKRGAAEILIEAWATQRQNPGSPEIRAFLIPYRAAAWFAGYESGPGFA